MVVCVCASDASRLERALLAVAPVTVYADDIHGVGAQATPSGAKDSSSILRVTCPRPSTPADRGRRRLKPHGTGDNIPLDLSFSSLPWPVWAAEVLRVLYETTYAAKACDIALFGLGSLERVPN